MPKITQHGGPTNADEPGYLDAIEARQVEGVAAASSVTGRSTLLGRYDATLQASGQAKVDAYRVRLDELETE